MHKCMNVWKRRLDLLRNYQFIPKTNNRYCVQLILNYFSINWTMSTIIKVLWNKNIQLHTPTPFGYAIQIYDLTQSLINLQSVHHCVEERMRMCDKVLFHELKRPTFIEVDKRILFNKWSFTHWWVEAFYFKFFCL